MAVQRVLPKSTVAIGSNTIVFAQALSGAVFLAVADAVFQSKLRDALSRTTLSESTIASILGAGALGYRQFVQGDDLRLVATCFNFAITRVFVSAFKV